MNEPNRPEHDTYTPARMESTFGRGVQLDASGRAAEPASHAADEVRSIVQALIEGRADANAEDVMAHLARALIEAQEQERQRLAEELHDGPAQAFANAIFQTEILERAILRTRSWPRPSSHRCVRSWNASWTRCAATSTSSSIAGRGRRTR